MSPVRELTDIPVLRDTARNRAKRFAKNAKRAFGPKAQGGKGLSGKNAKLLRWWSALQPQGIRAARYSHCKNLWKSLNHLERGIWSRRMKRDVAAHKAATVG